jgi:hypothetical protein
MDPLGLPKGTARDTFINSFIFDKRTRATIQIGTKGKKARRSKKE